MAIKSTTRVTVAEIRGYMRGVASALPEGDIPREIWERIQNMIEHALPETSEVHHHHHDYWKYWLRPWSAEPIWTYRADGLTSTTTTDSTFDVGHYMAEQGLPGPEEMAFHAGQYDAGG